MNRLAQIGVLCLTLSVIAGEASAQTVDSLLGRVPDSANFVVVINNRAILATPRANRERWSKMSEMEYLHGAIPIPQKVPLVVMGSQIDGGQLTGNWSVALFVAPLPLNMKAVAERQGGRVEKFGDYSAAVTPRYGYMIQLLNDVYGAMKNVNRQEFSRWLKTSGRSRKPVVNDYLKQVIEDSKGQHVAIVIDLEDLVEPSRLHARLGVLKSLAGKPAQEVDALEKLLLSVKGMRIAIKVGDTSRTKLRIDFSQEIGDNGPLLKSCLEELQGSLGIAIDELDKARWQFEPKAASVEAELSDESLARIMTIAAMPMYAGDVAPVGTIGEAAETNLIATRRYYRAVGLLLDDLQKQFKKATDYSKTAQWHENFADRINELPTENVDPDMVKFGYMTGDHLRMIGSSLKGVPIKVSAAAAGLDVRVAVVPSGAYRSRGRVYQGYGSYASSNSAEVVAQQAKAIASDALERDKIWAKIDEDRRQIRRKMLDKFKVDFDATK